MKKVEVHFKVNADFMKELQYALGVTSSNEVTYQALSLLKWLVDELKDNRTLVSVAHDLTDAYQLDLRLHVPVTAKKTLCSQLKAAIRRLCAD